MKKVVYIGSNRSATVCSIPINMLKAREQELVDAGKVIRLYNYRQKRTDKEFDKEFDKYINNLMLELEVIW